MIENTNKYLDGHFIGQQIFWGEGFMSPGGRSEICTLLGDLSIENKSVLDFGCGLGGPAVLMALEYGASSVIAVDIQSDQLEHGKMLTLKSGVENIVSFEKIETNCLPFNKSTFDVVFSNCVILHISDKLKTYRELYRVLKPGGNLVVGDFLTAVSEDDLSNLNTWHGKNTGLVFNFSTPECTEEVLNSIGYKDITLIDNSSLFKSHLKYEIAELGEKGKFREQILEKSGNADFCLQEWRRKLEMVENKQFLHYRIYATK